MLDLSSVGPIDGDVVTTSFHGVRPELLLGRYLPIRIHKEFKD
jgi:hypothetical protein